MKTEISTSRTNALAERLSALSRVADLVPPKPPRVTRLAQGPLDAAGISVTDPFAPDRAG